MNKELPSIFKAETNKKIENNKKVFYSKYESIGNVIERTSEAVNNGSNNQGSTNEVRSFSESLDSLLKNNQFIFNVPVEINLKNETLNTKLVSKVGDHVLTNTGKVIQLEDILFIKIKDMQ